MLQIRRLLSCRRLSAVFSLRNLFIFLLFIVAYLFFFDDTIEYDAHGKDLGNSRPRDFIKTKSDDLREDEPVGMTDAPREIKLSLTKADDDKAFGASRKTGNGVVENETNNIDEVEMIDMTEGVNELKEVPDQDGKTEQNIEGKLTEPNDQGKELVSEIKYGEPEDDMKDELNTEIEGEPENDIKNELNTEIEGEPENDIKNELNTEIEGDPENVIKDELNTKIEGEPENDIEDELNTEIEGEPEDEIKGELNNEMEGEIVKELVTKNEAGSTETEVESEGPANNHTIERVTNSSLQKTNILFLKTHKCGTSSMVNLFFLFGIRRKLNFVIEPFKRQFNIQAR